MGTTSVLGEEVYLTKEDLVQIKLSGKKWIIELPCTNFLLVDIATEIHNTTNLFNVVLEEHSSQIISPKIEIELGRKKKLVGRYYPDNYYTARIG